MLRIDLGKDLKPLLVHFAKEGCRGPRQYNQNQQILN